MTDDQKELAASTRRLMRGYYRDKKARLIEHYLGWAADFQQWATEAFVAGDFARGIYYLYGMARNCKAISIMQGIKIGGEGQDDG